MIRIDDIEIEVVKKKIKNINIRVLKPDGRVVVSAPIRVSNAVIESFVRSKIEWIKINREKMRNIPPKQELEYVTGESIYLFGKKYNLEVSEISRGSSVEIIGDTVLLKARADSSETQRKKYLDEWYRALLKEEISRLLPKWEQKIGLYSNDWQIKNMKTRWGSCNTRTRKIWISLNLAQKPLDCLEYVILHELAHLKVKNHGDEFKAILDFHMPNWRNIKKLLI